MLWRFFLLLLSYLSLAGHFLRYGENEIAIAIALVPLLALFRRTISNRILQLGLIAGVIAVWIPTTYEIAQIRLATGQPWLKMAIIMTAVMLFSLITAWYAHGIKPKKINE